MDMPAKIEFLNRAIAKQQLTLLLQTVLAAMLFLVGVTVVMLSFASPGLILAETLSTVQRLAGSVVIASGFIPMIGMPVVQKQLANDPAIVSVLPASLKPVLTPSLIETQGKAVWPTITPEKPLLNTTRMGIISGHNNTRHGRLRLIYNFPADTTHFVIKPHLYPAGCEDVGLYVRSGAQEQTLIAPQPHRFFIYQPLYFKTQSSTFSLEAIDHAQGPGGSLWITSPIPVGRVSYWVEQLLPHTILLGVSALIGLLYCCWTIASKASRSSPTSTIASRDPA